jgi:hypothetical protein
MKISHLAISLTMLVSVAAPAYSVDTTIDLIGHPNTDWVAIPSFDTGSYDLSAAPGNINSGVGNNEILTYGPIGFGAPSVGSTYTLSTNLTVGDDGGLVMGFANPSSGDFMEVLVLRESGPNTISATWLAGNGAPSLSQFLGNTPIIPGSPSVVSLGLAYTYLGASLWRMTGNITVNGATVFDETTGIDFTQAAMTSGESVAVISSISPGAGVNNVLSDIVDGRFTGPAVTAAAVVPEPSTAILLIGGVAAAVFGSRRRSRTSL